MVCLFKGDFGTRQNDLILANDIQAIKDKEGSHIIVFPFI
jgi:hypothetical protein